MDFTHFFQFCKLSIHHNRLISLIFGHFDRNPWTFFSFCLTLANKEGLKPMDISEARALKQSKNVHLEIEMRDIKIK